MTYPIKGYSIYLPHNGEFKNPQNGASRIGVYMNRNEISLKVRFTADLKKWIEEQASKNMRSQTAEVNFHLTEAKKRMEATA